MTPIPRYALRQRPAAVALLGLALVGLAGCGDPPTGTVTGHVRHHGQPVTFGQVSFLGADGVPACAAIGADGAYRAEHVPLGPAIVTVVSTPPRDPAKAPAPRVTGRTKDGRPKLAPGTDPAHRPKPPAATPAKYADTRTSDLRFTARGGLNQFDIDLK